MKEKVLLVMVDKAFKSVNNFKTEKEIIRAYDFILGKANEMLTLAIINLNLNEKITEKKIKKEKEKLELNSKIAKELEKNKEILLKDEKLIPIIHHFEEKFAIYKKILKA